MKISDLWKRHPIDDRPVPAPSPEIEEQTERLIQSSMEGIGQALRRSALVRQHLAAGALEIRTGRR